MSYRWKLEIFRMRAEKVARLIVRPRHWKHVKAGTFPGLEHSRTPFLGAYDNVFDAGASNGQFSSFALERWPSSIVHCFEPIPDCVARTRAVVGDRGVVHQVALGVTEKRDDLILLGRLDSSSFLPVQELANEVSDANEIGRISVKEERLDRYAESLDGNENLLKIDVQGFELDVLQGAGQYLNRFVDVYCECSFRYLYRGQALATEIIAFMASKGFVLVSIENPARNEERLVVQADLLFRRADHESVTGKEVQESKLAVAASRPDR